MENKNNGSHFLQKVRNHKEWVIVLTLLALVLSCIYTFFIVTPMYASTTDISLTLSDIETEYDIATQAPSMTTYAEMLKSDHVLEPVIEELGLEITSTFLRKQIDAVPIENSEVINLTVASENPYRASEIANAIPPIFEEITDEAMGVQSVHILNAAVPNMEPVRPNNVVNILIGTLLGFVISLGLVSLTKEEEPAVLLAPEEVQVATGYRSMGEISTFADEDYLILKVNKNQKKPMDEMTENEEVMTRSNRHRL